MIAQLVDYVKLNVDFVYGFLNLEIFAYYDRVATIYTADMDSFEVRASQSLLIIPWDARPMYPVILEIGMYSTDIYTIRAYCMLNTSDF